LSIDVQTTIEAFLAELGRFLPNLFIGIIGFVASFFISKLLARAAERAVKSQTEDGESVILVKRIVRWSILVLGTIFAIGQISPDLTAFLAGLGIAGIAVGYGIQDIARNFVAGLLLLIRQPFGKGDAVKISDYAGKVMEINLRDTVIRTWDGKTVILANSEVFGNAITNFSSHPVRRRTVIIGLGYGQDANRAMQRFLETMQSIPGVLDAPAPMIHAEELGNSAIQLAARFWVDQRTHSLLDVHSDVVLALNDAAERHGIELPYPIQTVKVTEVVHDEAG
jgi:small conductance mechanosensitive channel